MAAGLYNSAGVGASQLPQHVTTTPFGKVVGSGGIYRMQNGRLVEANYTPYGSSGWGEASWSTPSAKNVVLSGNGSGVSTGSQRSAEGSYIDAINTLLGGVDSARAAAAQSQARLTNAGSDLDSARAAAGEIGNSARQINGVAANLAPYAMALTGQGDALTALAQSLMNNDASIGGSAGEYLGAIRNYADLASLLSPENYVSRAASDVQSSFDNIAGQQTRDLSRRGVSAGSGAAMSLRQQLTRDLATELASAKTNAWDKGTKETMDAQANIGKMYGEAIDRGAAVQDQGTKTLAQAAGIWKTQADMFNEAAGLFNTQSGAFVNIGGQEVALGELDLKNDAEVRAALGQVASAQQALAEYYSGREPKTTRTTEFEYSNGKVTNSTSTKG